MQTDIHPALIDREEVREADRILRSCVHCGFCTAVCPTYQLLGDELDGPRGRIYLIKDMLEENEISPREVVHLDRCLTCRACETACPSGVEYGRLLDIGRQIIAEKHRRSPRVTIWGTLLRQVVPRRERFRALLRLGQWLRPVLPTVIGRKVPPRDRSSAEPPSPQTRHGRRVILLGGCAQSAATPGVNHALTRLLATRDIVAENLSDEGCCGALDYHLLAHDTGLVRMRALIDLLYPRLQDVEAVISTASGCGVTIKEYPRALQYDPDYAIKAREVAARVVDVSEFLADWQFDCEPVTLAFHAPCSLQHGQKLNGVVESILTRSGMRLTDVAEGHLCCGSAGTYSLMQPRIAGQLLKRKIARLQAGDPEIIATANVGCQMHLQSATELPVMHWVELLGRQLREKS